MKYLLISVCDRVITTEQFATEKLAQEQMEAELLVATEGYLEDMVSHGRAELRKHSAYCDHNGSNYDWQIVEL